MVCPACGQEGPDQANFCQYCGHALTLTTQAADIAATAESHQAAPGYAGFWRRFFSFGIDVIFILIVLTGADAVLGFILGSDMTPPGGIQATVLGEIRQVAAAFLGMMVDSAILWLYWALFESSTLQATLGKMALGIQVTDLHGNPISFAKATGRNFAKFISGLIFCIGFLMAGWTEKKQALHDIMAGTLVVKKQLNHETA